MALDDRKGVWKSGKGKGRHTPKGRQLDDIAWDEVKALLGDQPRRSDLLIEFMHLIQDSYGCLSAAHLRALAEEMRMSQAEVYEVATFYAHFDVVKEGEPKPPALTIRVCDSLSCELAGAEALQKALEDGLDANEVRVLRAPCMGRCDTAPVLEIGHNHIDHATVEKVQAAIAADDTHAHVPDYETYEDYVKSGGYASLLKLRDSGDWEAVQEQVLASGLRGLGGAGFPSGKKWGFVRGNAGPRYLAVNGDEGEPGTFKDRHYLERTPHLFLEGMLIAAWAVVCGEESAMIESIEGKRGIPRHRPPFVAQVGIFNRPTLVHNVETLLWVARVVREGPECLNSTELNGRKGLRSYSVSGRVKKPGVHLLPAGSTIMDIIDAAGGMADGHTFKAYQPGGPSSGLLPASINDVPLDFDTLQPLGTFIGSAAVVVLSDKDRARDAALNMLRFFEDESCGQCTPCRVGCEKAVKLMQADTWDETLLTDLCTAMTDASICGLGQAAPNPIKSVMTHFADEV